MVQGLKDKEQQRYYDELFMLYRTPGWAVVIDDMQRLQDLYNEVRTVTGVEDLNFRQGQLDIIHQLLTHQDRTESAYALALQEEHGDDAGKDVQTGGIAKIVGDADVDPSL